MIDQIRQVQNTGGAAAGRRPEKAAAKPGGFGAMLEERVREKDAPQVQSGINFSKHAMARACERGIELTPALLEQLQTSVDKAQEKGATNILAFNSGQAFIINVPYGRVITTMTQEEMRENCFTNIDGAVLL